MEHCELAALADAIWAAYQEDGNEEALATRHARFFRATFIPSLALALARTNDTDRRSAFADRFEIGLKRRLMKRPAPLESFVQTMVLAKQG